VKEKGKASFRVLSGGALIMVDALRAGAAGGVLAQADFAPELCVSLYEAFRQGQIKTTRELQQRLVPLIERINAPFGVSGIKAALDARGYRGGPPRPPLAALSASEHRAVADALHEALAGLDL